MNKLDACPVCGTRLVMPDILKRRYVDVSWPRRARKALIAVHCPKCPVTADVFEDTGVLVCFTPNQPLNVQVVRR